MGELSTKLSLLYNDGSKHSNYQNIPHFVREELNYNEPIDETWRGDTARFTYLLKEIDFTSNKTVADIGANTGFFTLSFAHLFRESVFTAFELNPTHTEFIKIISEHFALQNVAVDQKSVGIEQIDTIPYYDVMFHLNVLHHAGVDFDNSKVCAIQDFERYAACYLKQLSKKTKTLIFQLGYNWGGDKKKPLMPVNNISEMILYVNNIIKSAFTISKIAVYSNTQKEYININDSLLKDLDQYDVIEKIKRNILEIGIDNNSEFYNRPIFMLESINVNES
ncbi:DUF1698 domain-containing protein [Paenibacillus oleatilyticus]|uniref:DUF1698 domain-containing protein n=1 Tax=Paenibacillus oleatilyticus TaxID=2594886 RepID=A0ABV4V7V5_9BACL